MSTTTALAGTFASDPVHSSFGFAVKYQNVSIFRELDVTDRTQAALWAERHGLRPSSR